MTTVRIEELTAEAFAPFGDVVTRPLRAADAAASGWQWWAEVAALAGDGRPWTVGYLDLEPTKLQFDWAERHMRTVEGVFATKEDVLVYVGPGDDLEDPSRLPPLEDFRAFRVPAGAGVVLKRGVWHGAPLCAGAQTSALVLLLEGTGRDDVTVVRFPKTPVQLKRE